MTLTVPRSLRVLGLLAGLLLLLPSSTWAQEPDERDVRTYIPPDQLVSFDPSTPMDTFIEFVNPIFQRVTGKRVIDPESRSQAIGVDISQMHFFDALELVLEANNLGYRETEDAFLVRAAPTPGTEGETTQAEATAAEEALASLESRDIRINALFFQVNRTKTRELGVNWNSLLGGQQGGGRGGQAGGQAGGQQGGGRGGLNIFVRTDDIFDPVNDVLVGPDQVAISTLGQLFRFLESNGAGETIANPTISVKSGDQGRIQIGSDIPVQTRDFAGNTVTEFFSTGVIVQVTPTLISEPVADTLGAPEMDFIHMDVRVENSSSRPSGGGAPAIDRSVANTKVLLLDGEQTMIGGLYSTERNVTRQGIPLLKDLPAWFFGLRYIFGYEQVNRVQQELVIVLQAEVLRSLEARADQPPRDELLEKRRERVREVLRRFSEEKAEETETPPESY